MRSIVLAMALLSSCAAGRIITPQGATVQGVAFGCACLGFCRTSCLDPNDPNELVAPRIQGGHMSGGAVGVWTAFLSTIAAIGAAVIPLAI